MLYMIGFSLLFCGLILINFIFSYQGKHIPPAFLDTSLFQLRMIPLFFLANLCVGYGIKWAMKAHGNLGFVLTTGKCLEIVISLGMGYIFMREIPSTRVWLGLVIIAIGLLVMNDK